MQYINYTIIIPHKNIPQMLQRCLDSIPYRNDLQIIIVDDNSDPNIVDFDQFPGFDRSNTDIYFTKESKGAGYARNIGLQHAKGKWLIFADADDFFTTSINEAMDKYKDDENDIIYFHIICTNLVSEKHFNLLLHKIQRKGNWNIAYPLLHPWGKFVKNDFVKLHNIVYQETQYSNDELFGIKLLTLSIKKKISNFLIYHKCNRTENLTSQRNIDSLYIRFQVTCNTIDYLKKINKEKYMYNQLIYRWMELFYHDAKVGRRTFKKVIKTCGLWYVLTGIIWNITAIMRRYISAKLQKCQA